MLALAAPPDGSPGICGGGVPRLYVNFVGSTPSENTFDGVACTTDANGNGTVTYMLVHSGRIKSFAFISDRGDGRR